MFSTFKLWIYGIGSALVAGLVLYAKVLKKQRDDSRRTADVLRAGRESNRKKKKIIKEEEQSTKERAAELHRSIKEKNHEDFTGVDNLSNPNDNW